MEVAWSKGASLPQGTRDPNEIRTLPQASWLVARMQGRLLLGKRLAC
jgi:hypothetical protein